MGLVNDTYAGNRVARMKAAVSKENPATQKVY